ncbi:MAG: hypothetical protein EBX52_00580 [Proteobacteria bacterium]|nr:hypothetical protein [Pseudomonadota bacterium]
MRAPFGPEIRALFLVWVALAIAATLPLGPARAQNPPSLADPSADFNSWKLKELFVRENLSSNPMGLGQWINVAPVIGDPNKLNDRLGLGVQRGFSNPAGIVNYDIIPVSPERNGVLAPATGTPAVLLQAITDPVARAQMQIQITGSDRQCAINPAAAPGSLTASAPAMIPVSPSTGAQAILELQQDPLNPDIWRESGKWSVLYPDTPANGQITVLNATATAKKPTNHLVVEQYRVGGTDLPSGIRFTSDQTTSNGARLSTQANLSVQNLGGTAFSFRITPASNPLGSKTSLQYLVLARPLQQYAVTGMSVSNQKGTSTFVGYETQSIDHTGHLIIQTTYQNQTRSGIAQTVGIVARVGSSPEVTGLYQLRSGNVIASASVTPMKMASMNDASTTQSSMNAGLQFSDYHVSAFVNLRLVKN